MAHRVKLKSTLRNFSLLNTGVLAGVLGKVLFDRFYKEDEKSDAPDSVAITDASLEEFSKRYGLPTSSNVLPYKRHIVCYDQSKRIPSWVIQHLNKEQLRGDADRVHSYFKADQRIQRVHSASNDDYLKSGYSRGHLVPAADNGIDQEAMDDTFYLSNIIPQNPENNAGYWYRMEHYCRELTKRFSDIYVISGPLFLPKNEKEKTIMKYEVIGKNRIAVPTHLFKVILVENHGTPAAIGSFIVPNEPIPPDRPLRSFQVSLQQLQMESGLALFKDETVSRLPQLCALDGCHLSKQDIVDFKNLSRKLRKAKSVEELEQIWSKARTQNVAMKSNVVDLYRSRKQVLLSNSDRGENS